MSLNAINLGRVIILRMIIMKYNATYENNTNNDNNKNKKYEVKRKNNNDNDSIYGLKFVQK